MAEVKRRRRSLESRLVYEWTVANYRTAFSWRKKHLGPLPDVKKPSYYSMLRRWADLVVDLPDKVIIVEAKMRPDPGAISQLELYKKLLPLTPELTPCHGKPIELVFLTTMRDEMVEDLCKEKGIRYVVYQPKWVKEYWEEVQYRR